MFSMLELLRAWKLCMDAEVICGNKNIFVDTELLMDMETICENQNYF